MIHIENGTPVKESPNLKVAVQSGDYDDAALIECTDSADPSAPRGAFQAQFIKYGNIVYQFTDPRELGAEILKLDPESAHAAAVFVRLSNELLAQMNDGSLQPSSLDEAKVAEQVEEVAETSEEPQVPNEEVPEPEAAPAPAPESEPIPEPVPEGPAPLPEPVPPAPSVVEGEVLGEATSASPVIQEPAITPPPELIPELEVPADTSVSAPISHAKGIRRNA